MQLFFCFSLFPFVFFFSVSLRQRFVAMPRHLFVAPWKCFRGDIHMLLISLCNSFFTFNLIRSFGLYLFPFAFFFSLSLRQRFVAMHRQRFVVPWKCFRGVMFTEFFSTARFLFLFFTFFYILLLFLSFFSIKIFSGFASTFMQLFLHV